MEAGPPARETDDLKEIYGNTLGLKANEQHRLRNTYRRRVAPYEIVSPELARHLTELSSETNRQVGVLINRKGEIEYVVVGNAHKLELPDIGRARAGQVRLRGLRLVHTHLKSEPLTKDDLTDLALLRLDMVAAVGVGHEGLPGVLHYAHLVPENGTGEFWRVSTLPSVHNGQPDLVDTLEALEEEFNRKAAARAVGGREKAILVAVCLDGNRGQGRVQPGRAQGAGAHRGRRGDRQRAPGAPRGGPALPHRPRQAGGPQPALHAVHGGPAHLRQGPDALAGPPHRRGHQPQGARPHAAHPGHLRPARAERRGQAAGGAGPAEVPAAAAGAER